MDELKINLQQTTVDIFAGGVHYTDVNKSDHDDFYVPILLTLTDLLHVYVSVDTLLQFMRSSGRYRSLQ